MVSYYYDIDAIREPHVTFTSKSRMKGGRGHFGKKNGTPEQGKNTSNANLHNGRWDQAFHPKGRNRRTVWDIPLSKFREAHFAVFPDRLVELCILAGCPKDGIVLDRNSAKLTLLLLNLEGRLTIGEACAQAARRMNSRATPSQSRPPPTGGTAAGRLGPT